MDRAKLDWGQELRRKAIHLSALAIPAAVYWLPRRPVVLGLLLLTVGFLIAELLRLGHRSARNVFSRLFGSLIRDHEDASLTGSTFFLVGSLLTVCVFRTAVAVAALCFLILGDSVAALVGRSLGKTRLLGGKTLEGAAANFIVCFAVGTILLPLPLAAIGALATAVVELLPIPLDDNLRIPLAAGAAIEVARLFL
jgi:dolichol kinase